LEHDIWSGPGADSEPPVHSLDHDQQVLDPSDYLAESVGLQAQTHGLAAGQHHNLFTSTAKPQSDPRAVLLPHRILMSSREHLSYCWLMKNSMAEYAVVARQSTSQICRTGAIVTRNSIVGHGRMTRKKRVPQSKSPAQSVGEIGRSKYITERPSKDSH
jgi:hypothetical protein